MKCIKKKILWMKTIHYPNIVRSHLVTIIPMVPLTPKSTPKLRFALHFRYSIFIPRFIPRANYQGWGQVQYLYLSTHLSVLDVLGV